MTLFLYSFRMFFMPSTRKTRTITVPDFLSFSPRSTTTLLVIVLIIAAYLLGNLTAKVKYLEKGTTAGTGTAAQPADPQTAGAAPVQPTTGKVTPISDEDHIRGNENAEVSIVEYSDLECPFCKTFHPTAKAVFEQYGDKVNWVYRHYPLSFHANAQIEAEASECVADQGGDEAFWSFVDKIFERTTANGTGFALDKLGPLAAEVGVNQGEFQKCLDSGKFTKKVQDQFAEGSTAGVSGTPTTFIVKDGEEENSAMIVGAQPKESLTAAIDKALE